MATIVIDGIPPYDGEWEFEGELTGRENRRIKEITGLAGIQFDEAIENGDYDAVIGLAAVALERHGKEVDVDLLLDGKMSAITARGDAGPPELPQPEEKKNAAEPSSGGSSSPDSESQASDQSPIGVPV